MARQKTANRTPLIIFAVLTVLAAAGIGVWFLTDTSRAKQEQATAAANPPVLPNGRLQELATSFDNSTYLDLDTVKRDGPRISANLLKVGRTATSIPGGGALMSQDSTVDCATGRVFDGQSGVYDIDGKLISAAARYASKRGRMAEPADYHVAVLCEGKAGRVVVGFRGAQREAQDLPDGYEKVAQARPKDPDAWAWLCAAGTRDRWRDETPADCDRALSLRPDDAATRLDRAYIFLQIGRRGEAAQDFQRVLAKDPKNAAALYGRSLLTGIRSGVAASKADRCAALAIDPGVAQWAATTYRIPASHEFRVCDA